jgi:Potassium-transporting ATPase A subunit/Prolipoprotein diacylglyceryl transferase
MSTTTAGVLFLLSLVVALVAAYRPVGDYLYRTVTSTRHLRVERAMYRVMGANPGGEQPWGVYARSVLAFSAVSILFLYAFLRLQKHLVLSLGRPGVDPDGAWNTAVSFTTNTNWQWYSGESTMGHLVQMSGLAVQNFVSAAVGIAVAVGAVGAWLGCRQRGISLVAFADALAPGLVLAQAIGRWGNWFNQELYGAPSTLPWALHIDPAHRPADSPRSACTTRPSCTSRCGAPWCSCC